MVQTLPTVSSSLWLYWNPAVHQCNRNWWILCLFVWQLDVYVWQDGSINSLTSLTWDHGQFFMHSAPQLIAGFRRVIDTGRQKAFRRVCYGRESQWRISVHELSSLQPVVMHGGMWISCLWWKLGTRQLRSQMLQCLFLCKFSGCKTRSVMPATGVLMLGRGSLWCTNVTTLSLLPWTKSCEVLSYHCQALKWSVRSLCICPCQSICWRLEIKQHSGPLCLVCEPQ